MPPWQYLHRTYLVSVFKYPDLPQRTIKQHHHTNMNMKNKILNAFIIIILMLQFGNAISQVKETTSRNSHVATDKKDYAKYPYWISMMHDPNVNYFEAKIAYDEFWRNREKPVLEEEELMEYGVIAVREEQSKLRKREIREQQELRKYAYDVKYFEHWQRTVEPYVQEDGRILSAEEKLQIWYNQKNQQ